jgi:competence CoiA-like predicted nuclease
VLVALDSSGIRTLASIAHKEIGYSCPICHKDVILKQGPIKIHHYAHYPESDCENAGESYRHIEIKAQLAQYAEKEGIEITANNFEVPFDRRRADIFFVHPIFGRIVFEVQTSPISVNELLNRTCEYRLFSNVAWVFDHKARLLKNETKYLLDRYKFVNSICEAGLLRLNYWSDFKFVGLHSFERELISSLITRLPDIHYFKELFCRYHFEETL